MSQSSIEAEAEFDAYAAEYDALLARGISISGEDKNYFASGRVVWLARCLACLQKHPRTAMDFGCGTGSATPFLLNELKLDELVGVDASVQSLAIARHAHGNRAQVCSSCGISTRGSLRSSFLQWCLPPYSAG